MRLRAVVCGWAALLGALACVERTSGGANPPGPSPGQTEFDESWFDYLTEKLWLVGGCTGDPSTGCGRLQLRRDGSYHWDVESDRPYSESGEWNFGALDADRALLQLGPGDLFPGGGWEVDPADRAANSMYSVTRSGEKLLCGSVLELRQGDARTAGPEEAGRTREQLPLVEYPPKVVTLAQTEWRSTHPFNQRYEPQRFEIALNGTYRLTYTREGCVATGRFCYSGGVLGCDEVETKTCQDLGVSGLVPGGSVNFRGDYLTFYSGSYLPAAVAQTRTVFFFDVWKPSLNTRAEFTGTLTTGVAKRLTLTITNVQSVATTLERVWTHQQPVEWFQDFYEEAYYQNTGLRSELAESNYLGVVLEPGAQHSLELEITPTLSPPYRLIFEMRYSNPGATYTADDSVIVDSL